MNLTLPLVALKSGLVQYLYLSLIFKIILFFSAYSIINLNASIALFCRVYSNNAFSKPVKINLFAISINFILSYFIIIYLLQ